MSEHIGADEAQALLDAAMGDAEDGNTGDELFDMFVGDNNVVVWPDGDHVATVFPPVMTGSDPHALAELFAAAPRLAAEVVRLRRELHQWEMSAATLARVVRLLDNNPNAATFDRDDVAGAVGDQLAAARLLGGGE